MKNSKGYPYREKRKAKTKQKEDHRPHLGHWSYVKRFKRDGMWTRDWVPNKPEETHESRRFHRPDIRHHDRSEWTLQEAHTLIDMWAEVSWGLGSSFHSQMSQKARYFRRLWKKQEGRCAITGIELHGAPGCGGRGIGIDIINYDFGIRKGNLRLVSAPLAITRLTLPDCRTQQIAQITPKNYKEWPIFFAILKHYQWWLIKKQPFKHLPVDITFPTPTIVNQSEPRRSPWVEFRWHCRHPCDNTVEAWEDFELQNNSTKFMSICFQDDVINVEILKERHGVHPIHERSMGGAADFSIQLCDPHVDFNKQLTQWALLGFSGIHRFLGSLGENW